MGKVDGVSQWMVLNSASVGGCVPATAVTVHDLHETKARFGQGGLLAGRGGWGRLLLFRIEKESPSRGEGGGILVGEDQRNGRGVAASGIHPNQVVKPKTESQPPTTSLRRAESRRERERERLTERL